MHRLLCALVAFVFASAAHSGQPEDNRAMAARIRAAPDVVSLKCTLIPRPQFSAIVTFSESVGGVIVQESVFGYLDDVYIPGRNVCDQFKCDVNYVEFSEGMLKFGWVQMTKYELDRRKLILRQWAIFLWHEHACRKTKVKRT